MSLIDWYGKDEVAFVLSLEKGENNLKNVCASHIIILNPKNHRNFTSMNVAKNIGILLEF